MAQYGAPNTVPSTLLSLLLSWSIDYSGGGRYRLPPRLLPPTHPACSIPLKLHAQTSVTSATSQLLTIRSATRFCSLIFAAAISLVASGPSSATEPASSPGELKFFEQNIRPLLVARCYECHSGEEREGGLALDRADSLSVGGDSGSSVIAGDLDGSLLVSAVRYEGLQMPPDEPVSEREVALVERWVRDGAAWPVSDKSGTEERTGASADENWWAAQPIESSDIPAPVQDVVSPTLVDRFLDAKLSEAGLHRAPATDRVRLIRRLSFDLLGLPPTAAEIDRFVSDGRPDAIDRLIDSMFANPAYGERMARRWLDLVRYAESDGYRADAYRPAAWRYRDFVVGAFNSKLTYDQFLSWQIAGDQLEPINPAARDAVGFLRLGIYEYNQRDAEGQWEVIVDELTDVTADVFLATGLACAKCHDHKFDPIPRSDYFNLRAVFEPLVFTDERDKYQPGKQDQVESLLAQLRAVELDDVDQLSQGAVDRFPDEVQAAYEKPVHQRTSYEHQLAYLVQRQILEEALQPAKVKKKLGEERYSKREAIRKQLASLDADPYAVADRITVTDWDGEVRPTRLPGREIGRKFSPAAPTVFGATTLVSTRSDSPISAASDGERGSPRAALASWMVSTQNPIVARVIVNRLWQYHFGRGLVASPNDFGFLGTKPTHPGLLDFLATELIQHDWNLQHIQRLIVTSAAYRQSSVHSNSAHASDVDPENSLLWHWPIGRLDAEQYRDSLLVAMDRLIDQVGGPSVAGTPGRRTIYLRRYRNKSDEMLAAMDAPTGVVGMPSRDVTTTAPQSLMMLNNSRIMDVAKTFSGRVAGDVAESGSANFDRDFVHVAHRILTGHDASEATLDLLTPLAGDPAGRVDLCHILLNSNAFLFVD